MGKLAVYVAVAALGAFPAHANCVGVSYLDGDWMTFVDLDNRSYTEYRFAGAIVAPPERNPAGRAVEFRFLVEHDLKSDAVVGASAVAQIRESKDGPTIGLLTAASRIEVATDSGATASDAGTMLGLRRDRPELIMTDPTDPAAGRAIYDTVAAGGTIRMRFTYNEDGKPPLDASLTAAFATDPAYQAAAGKRARELDATWRRTHKCPLNPFFG